LREASQELLESKSLFVSSPAAPTYTRRAYLIDVDDSGYGYWIWDIAVALCRLVRNNDWERMRDAFFAGYSQHRSLPAAQ
jgi:Ser/Thr protein kinase RdoA (MazF antagonist)